MAATFIDETALDSALLQPNELPPSPASLLGDTTGELVLRVANGSQRGRLVRLAAKKCSIGSAANCTLRLRGEGIDPVHCLILRGSRQTIVRRWSNETRLNDRRFDDAALETGDRLSLGPIELCVVSIPNETGAATPPPRRIEAELAAATVRLERLTERLDLANRQGRRRLRAVMAKLRKYQLRLNDVEGRRSQLAGERSQLATERARLAALENELKSATAELDRRRQACEAEQKSLVAQAARLQAESALRAAEERRRELALNSQTEELERRAERLAADLTAAEAERSRLDREAGELRRREDELKTQSRAVDDRLLVLEEGRRALATREADLLRQTDELRRRAAAAEEESAHLLARRQAVDEQAAAAVAARDSGVAAVSAREQAVEARFAELVRREAEAASRCESLKNHWSELTAREQNLERDRAALTAREQRLAEQESQAATLAPPAVATVSQADEAATTAAAEALDFARAELAGERETLERREAELAAARASWEAQLTEQEAAMAAERTGHEESRLDDRLRIEQLEAQLKAWREEAELWRERFNEKATDTATLAAAAVAPAVEIEPPSVGTSPALEDPEEMPDHDVQLPETDELRETSELPLSAVEEVGEELTLDKPVADVGDEELREAEEAPGAVADEAAEAEVVEHGKSESAADVLRRMGLMSNLHDEPSDATPARPEPQRMETPKPQPAPTAGAGVHHEGDEALDDYMQQLFQRLGVKQSGPMPSKETKPEPAVPSRVAVVDAPAAEKTAEPDPSLPPLAPGEFKARSVAAERKSDLSALRELANMQAKTNIAKHDIKRGSSKSKWKLRVGAASIAGGLVCGGLYLTGHEMLPGYPISEAGAALGLTVGAFCLLQSLGLNYKAKKSARSLNAVLKADKRDGNPSAS